MNRGGVGGRALNVELQSAPNPPSNNKVERFGGTFAPRDKLMQIKSDYRKEVYNGRLGYVENVDCDTGEMTTNSNGRLVA